MLSRPSVFLVRHNALLRAHIAVALLALPTAAFAGNCTDEGRLYYLGNTADGSQSAWLSITRSGAGGGAYSLTAASHSVLVDSWQRTGVGQRLSLSADVSNGNGGTHKLESTNGKGCLLDTQNQKGGILPPGGFHRPPVKPITPELPMGVVPPIGTLPPTPVAPITPELPMGVVPPVGTLPPAPVVPITPELPMGVVPPIGTLPPTPVAPITPELPMGVVPPIGTLPPTPVVPITPELPMGVVPPIGTLPPTPVVPITPELPMGVVPPVGTLPPAPVVPITPELPMGVVPPIAVLPPSPVDPITPTRPPLGVLPTLPSAAETARAHGVPCYGGRIDPNDPRASGDCNAPALEESRDAPYTAGRVGLEPTLWNLWTDFTVTTSHDARNALDLKSNATSMSVGGDRVVADGLALGVQATATQGEAHSRQHNIVTEGDGLSVGPYASYRLTDHWSLLGTLDYSQVDRDLEILGLTGRQDIDQYSGNLELQGQYAVESLTLRPRVWVSHMRSETGSFAMKGDLLGLPLNLTAHSTSADYDMAEAGLQADWSHVTSRGDLLVPYLEGTAHYVHARSNGLAIGDTSESVTSGWSGAARTGLRVLAAENSMLDLNVAYQSLGQSNLDVWEIHFFISHGFR